MSRPGVWLKAWPRPWPAGRGALVAVALLLAAGSPAHAAPADGRFAAPADGRVAAVLDGDTLTLEDGRTVRLAGIEAPRPPPGRETERRWPLAEGATRALGELTLGRAVALSVAAEDRHGRLLALVVRDDGLRVQDELLRRGLARVHTRPDARERAHEMMAVEAEARAAGRGLWRTRVYAVRAADPQALRRDRDSFQIVEGRVAKASRVRDQVYLNFAEDWKSDFTVRIGHDGLRAFARALIDPLRFEGVVIRVRGWIVERNGPMIEATHPEQIERVAETPQDSHPLPDLPPPVASAGSQVRREPRGGGGLAPSTAIGGGGLGRGPEPSPPPDDEDEP